MPLGHADAIRELFATVRLHLFSTVVTLNPCSLTTTHIPAQTRTTHLCLALFTEADVERLLDMADKDNSTEPEAFKVAARYFEECEMAAFVAEQNVTLGIAPSTEFLLDRWRVRRSMYPEACRPKDVGSVAENKGRL